MKSSTLVMSQADRLAATVCAAAGAVSLLVGWLGVSRTAYPAEQIPYIASAGLGGLFLLGVAATLWISADLRDEWRKLDRLEQAVLGSADATSGARVEASVPAASGPDAVTTTVGRS